MCYKVQIILDDFFIWRIYFPNIALCAEGQAQITCPCRDQEGPPWISEGPCAKPLLSLTTSYTSKVAMERRCRNEVPHFTAVMANLGWKMFLVYASGLWCSDPPRSPALPKRVFPKAVVDFSQVSLCTGQDCWQLNIQLQNIIFCHFDLCSSL